MYYFVFLKNLLSKRYLKIKNFSKFKIKKIYCRKLSLKSCVYLLQSPSFLLNQQHSQQLKNALMKSFYYNQALINHSVGQLIFFLPLVLLLIDLFPLYLKMIYFLTLTIILQLNRIMIWKLNLINLLESFVFCWKYIILFFYFKLIHRYCVLKFLSIIFQIRIINIIKHYTFFINYPRFCVCI